MLDELDSEQFLALLGLGSLASFSSLILLSKLSFLAAPLSDKVDEIYKSAAAKTIASGYGSPINEDFANYSAAAHKSNIENFNKTTYYEILDALTIASSLEDDDSIVDTAVKIYLAKVLIQSIFDRLRVKRKPIIVDTAVYGPYNSGVFDAVQSRTDAGAGVRKQWVTRHDSRVRPAHRLLNGTKVPFNNAFYIDGLAIRFPHDPLAPPSATVNCRCYLKLSL